MDRRTRETYTERLLHSDLDEYIVILPMREIRGLPLQDILDQAHLFNFLCDFENFAEIGPGLSLAPFVGWRELLRSQACGQAEIKSISLKLMSLPGM